MFSNMSITTIQAEASQCLFEFLHMEIVSQLQKEAGPDKKVSVEFTCDIFLSTLTRDTD